MWWDKFDKLLSSLGLGLMNGDNGNNERAARRSLITDQMIADISPPSLTHSFMFATPPACGVIESVD